MPFWRKFFYYLIGVVLGIFLVGFLFGGRDIQCSYFPNDRVLYDLRKKERIVPAEVVRELSNGGMDTSAISSLFLTGDVDFKKSHTHDDDSCHIYWINSRGAERAFSAEVQNCDSTATVLTLTWR